MHVPRERRSEAARIACVDQMVRQKLSLRRHQGRRCPKHCRASPPSRPRASAQRACASKLPDMLRMAHDGPPSRYVGVAGVSQPLTPFVLVPDRHTAPPPHHRGSVAVVSGRAYPARPGTKRRPQLAWFFHAAGASGLSRLDDGLSGVRPAIPNLRWIQALPGQLHTGVRAQSNTVFSPFWQLPDHRKQVGVDLFGR
jgi:hypothetical protein